MEVQVVLDAAQRGRIRRLSQARELSPDEEGGELNVVPYLDIMVNILVFVLATIAVTFTASIDVKPPAAIGAGPTAPGLGLTVFVASDGFSLKTSGGNVAPGCEGPGPGLSIPKRAGAYDFEALNACASKLKHASAKFEAETQAFITANPGTDYETVVQTIDSLRGQRDGQPLFPDVGFRVPR